MSMSWTIVHPIDENSPMLGWDKEQFSSCQVELFVTIKAYDETRSQHVFWRGSFKDTEMIWGAKFKPMNITIGEKGNILYDLRQLNEYESAALPY